jgi:hypothetical protein
MCNVAAVMSSQAKVRMGVTAMSAAESARVQMCYDERSHADPSVVLLHPGGVGVDSRAWFRV